ncbi:MFS transporter [Kineosporia sp. A_224]|uniref:MFS transporter n=1 Tax=Kineosporia sp. A_224 TaxID=1962180 RepID=UPI0013046F72|nr:MFS transporter [Kineosporia sp. A_224]
MSEADHAHQPRSAVPFWTVAVVLTLFLTGASAPSPMYALYASRWHFSPTTLTAVFAVYAIALLAVLLTCGGLSDAVGRRPVLLAGIAVQTLAMGIFFAADGVGWLFAARVVQGVATGLVTAAAAAALLDLQPRLSTVGPLVNALAPSVGLALGAVGAGALVQYAPAPLHLTYAVLVVLLLGSAVATALLVPGATTRRPVSLRPRVSVPRAVRPAFWAALPVLVSTWGLGGFYLSLGPSLVLSLAGSSDRLLGGALPAVLCVSGAAACLVLNTRTPERMMQAGTVMLLAGLLLSVASIAGGTAAGLLASTFVSGAGFGSAFLGAFRSLVVRADPARRGELLAAVFTAAYLSFSLPAIVGGLVATRVGLQPTAVGYAGVLSALAAVALGLRVAAARRPAPVTV